MKQISPAWSRDCRYPCNACTSLYHGNNRHIIDSCWLACLQSAHSSYLKSAYKQHRYLPNYPDPLRSSPACFPGNGAGWLSPTNVLIAESNKNPCFRRATSDSINAAVSGHREPLSYKCCGLRRHIHMKTPRHLCFERSGNQLAVFSTCHTPLKSGLPFAIRGGS